MTTVVPPRVIPSLLLQDGRLVKTCQFGDPVYVGDPVNVISIFNEFEVDEIVLLDIRATVEGRPPPMEVLAAVADEAIVPLAYGGGVTSLEQFGRILWTGYEKVVLGTASVTNPRLLGDASAKFGRQAVVVAIDAKRDKGGDYEVMTHSGTRGSGRTPVDHAREVVDLGAGEILVTSIDQEGTMQGYDLDLVEAVSDAVSVPVIACGGAGRRADLTGPVHQARASAVAAGSLFVFSGPQRAILINFPSRRQLSKLFESGPSAPEQKGS